MIAGDLIGIGKLLKKYMYNLTEVNELVRCYVGCDQKGKIVCTVRGETVHIYSSGQTILS
jgi:hypothetical protein